MRALLILIVAVNLCGQEQTRNPHTSRADIAAGARTFRSHCSPCHGMNGEGGRGPNLASGRFYHGSSDLDLLNNIANGIPGTEMPGLFYSSDRLWQVVAYIRSLNVTAGPRPKGNIARGQKLYQSNGCPQCHRIKGEGGRLGPDLTQIGESCSPAYLHRALIDPNADIPKRYWVVKCRDASGSGYEGFLMNEDTYTVQFIDMHEQLHSFEKAKLTDYKVEKISKMPSFQNVLSDSQLDDLVAFLSSLRTPRGLQ